jgi:hypothetical protein
MRCRLSLAVLLLTLDRADAQVTVGVQLNPEGDALAQQLGITSAELASRMQTTINDAYGATNVDGFIRSFADATAFSMRGLGVDYASDPNSLILGVGINVAVAAGDEISESERPTAGLAPNIGFMAGLNLASQGAPRWTIFGNGFYRKGSTEDLRGGILSAGLHVQYRLVNPQVDKDIATKALRWTGIDLTAGLEFTRWTLGVNDAITTDLGVDGTNGSANLVLDSTGTYDLSSTAVTVPVEATTGLRIALLVSIYVGAALDFTAGKGKLDANLNGTLLTSDNRQIGTATISGGGEESASPFAARVMAGAQLNLWKLKLYTQLTASPSPLAASVGLGIRGVL